MTAYQWATQINEAKTDAICVVPFVGLAYQTYQLCIQRKKSTRLEKIDNFFRMFPGPNIPYTLGKLSLRLIIWKCTKKKPLAPQTISLIPATKSAYTEIKLLGKGAFGEVVAAKVINRNGDQLSVVVKKSHIDAKDSKENYAASILEEERIAELNRHDLNNFVVKFHTGFDVSDRGYCICFLRTSRWSVYAQHEEDLYNFMKRHKFMLPLHTVKIIKEQFSQALDLFAKYEIVHADIKLENIVCNYNALNNSIQIAFIDFGISFKIDSPPKENNLIVSWPYRPPELVCHTVLKAEETTPEFKEKFRTSMRPAIDIWSAGMTLFVLYSSRHPMQLNSHISRLKEHEYLAQIISKNFGPFDKEEFNNSYLGIHTTPELRDRVTDTTILPTFESFFALRTQKGEARDVILESQIIKMLNYNPAERERYKHLI